MIKYDVAKYGTKFLISTAVLQAYNILVDGKRYNDMAGWYDAASFGLSNVISNVGNDLLYHFLNMSNGGLLPMLSEPLMNMFLYSYFYDQITRPSVRGLGNERSQTTVLIIGGLGGILENFIESPLLSLWGMASYK